MSLVVLGLLVGFAGTALVDSDAWLLGYGLVSTGATVWLVGCVALGVRIGLRGSRAEA